MVESIAHAIDKFSRLLDRASPMFHVQRGVSDTAILTPRGYRSPTPIKDIDLSIMAITHGNEGAGVFVLNHLLEALLAQALELRISLGLILANPAAARANRRFLERDLNRSFGRQDPNPQSLEEQRARALESILGRTVHLLDIHQTMQPSDRPFFIFPFRRDALEWARSMAPTTSIVTHWGRSFSTDGLCSDEYVNAQGGLGLTVELGQKGYCDYQIATGLQYALWALKTTERRLGGASFQSTIVERESPPPRLFTWNQMIPWPAAGLVTLDPGWSNFQMVQGGQRLGEVDGKALLSPASGPILFPKYLTQEEQRTGLPRPAELLRIMRPISETDLPG